MTFQVRNVHCFATREVLDLNYCLTTHACHGEYLINTGVCRSAQYLDGFSACDAFNAVIVTTLFSNPLPRGCHPDKVGHGCSGDERSEVCFVDVEKLLEVVYGLSLDLWSNRICAAERILIECAYHPITNDGRGCTSAGDKSKVTRTCGVGDLPCISLDKK